MLPTSTAKLDAARMLFDRHLEPRFRNALGAPPEKYEVITPKLFQHHLFTKARRDPKRIVLPEGNDRRVVVAADELLERNLVELIILGNREEILAIAEEAGVVISEEAKAHVTIIDPEACDPELFDKLAAGFYDLRKHKGVDLEKSKPASNSNFFGARHRRDGRRRDRVVSTQVQGTSARRPEHLRRDDDEIGNGGRHGQWRVPLDCGDDAAGFAVTKNGAGV